MTIPADTILIGDCRAIHPAEKPTGLIEILVRASRPPGGVVGDWFVGSGSVDEACRLSGHLYLGYEVDAEIAERARSRIAAVLPFDDGGAA
jgi:site-specific DNA-methyltransferase (adenine-specific)